MTLVAAFRGPKGGILLCADREENDGYTRREVDKIYYFNMVPCQVFVAGAGPSGIVTTADVEIRSALFKAHSDGANIIQEHKSIVESTLRDIHKRYAANLKSGYLDLLIVIAPLGQVMVPLLYRTELAMMVPEPYYAAYGSGKALCDYFSDRLYEYGRLDKDSMKVLATFILRETEKAASGVGLGADMWFIHEGDTSVHRISTGVIREFQALIPSIEESLWSDWKTNVKIPQQFTG